jgi:hypothetical protein
MSKIALEPNISGTGVFTIKAPNSNTNRTLDLPDVSGVTLVGGAKVSTGDVAITGYIVVKDSNGNDIKLAIIA